MAEIVSGIESARFYVSRFGFYPVPAPWGEKGPRTPGWQKLQLTEADLDLHFNGGRQNVGVRLGDPPGLCDVDLDAPEAAWAWMDLGLKTGFVFGHRSNPASHHFFLADPPVKTKPYDDPLPGEKKKRLIELRSLGGFQLLPPSRHPSGEDYEWAQGRAPGAPAGVKGDQLEETVARCAAAMLLARHFRDGTRHHCFLALAGGLARAGWPEPQTRDLVRAVYRILWRHEAQLDDGDREVADTYDKHQRQDRNYTGLTNLRYLIAPLVFERLVDWLAVPFAEKAPPLAPLWPASGFSAAAAPAPAPEKPPKKLPEPARLLDELKDRTLRIPVEMIQSCVTQPGVTLVNANNKAGKTVLTVQMLMSVSTGEHFLDYFDVNPRAPTPTLLLQWDDLQGEVELRQYLDKARAAKTGMPFYYVVPRTDPDSEPLTLNDPEFLPFLKSQIRKTGAKLVAIDSYSALRAARGKGGDVVKLDAEDILLLQRVALETDCAILLIHHDSKSSASLDWASRGAGSYAIGAASDAIIYLTRYPELAEDEGARLVSIRSRRMQGAEFAVRYRKESKDFDLILVGPGARDYPEIRKLHRAFPSSTTPFQHKEASEALGVSTPTVYRVCSRLVASGVLRKESNGWTWDPQFDRSHL